LETSAKNAQNVEEAFLMMTRQIKERVSRTTEPNKPSPSGVALSNTQGK